jgi:hypothetical protein
MKKTTRVALFLILKLKMQSAPSSICQLCLTNGRGHNTFSIKSRPGTQDVVQEHDTPPGNRRRFAGTLHFGPEQSTSSGILRRRPGTVARRQGTLDVVREHGLLSGNMTRRPEQYHIVMEH